MRPAIRDGIAGVRATVTRLTREWRAREGFSQEGLLAGRTITPPRRDAAATASQDGRPREEREPVGGWRERA